MTMTMLNRAGVSLWAVVVALGCGGEQAEPKTAAAQEPVTRAEAPAEPAEPEVAAPATWAEATTEKQKGAFMEAHVVPKMGSLFQAFDADEYKEFGCKTCHGEPFNEHPTDFLPTLTFKGGKMTAFEEHPAAAKFMGDKVLPEMIAILGQKPYDPKTNEGFGCNGCHTVEMK